MWGDEVSSPEAGVTRIACIRRARGGGSDHAAFRPAKESHSPAGCLSVYRDKGESGGDPDCGDTENIDG